MKMLVFDFNQTKVDTNPNFEKEQFEIEKNFLKLIKIRKLIGRRRV